jgi:hypothetical protein
MSAKVQFMTWDKLVFGVNEVHGSVNLARHVWYSKNKEQKWTWAEAQHNPALATVIMNWQLKHHLILRRDAVAAAVCLC